MSGGDGGFGADVKLNHRLGQGSDAYVGYALLTDQPLIGGQPLNLFTRGDGGTLVAGVRQRFSDAFSVYGENRVGLGGTSPSAVRFFGLRFDPIRQLSISGTFEDGRIDDVTTGPFRRTAGSLSVGYTDDTVRLGSAAEVRVEDGVGRDQTVWLFRNDAAVRIASSFRALARLNVARAEGNGDDVAAASFTEAVAGLAFRPVDARANALLKVTYFEDLSPVGQLSGTTANSPRQRSTVFSLDGNVGVATWLTLGGKYAYREGSVSLGRGSDRFVGSEAYLGIARADLHIDRNWDLTGEGRALVVTAAYDQRLGMLGAIYRRVGSGLRVGVGYSLSDFSDELTDQSYSSQAPFLNVLGKF